MNDEKAGDGPQRRHASAGLEGRLLHRLGRTGGRQDSMQFNVARPVLNTGVKREFERKNVDFAILADGQLARAAKYADCNA